MPSALNSEQPVNLNPAPRSVLLLRPDGMGDLVLFEPVLRELRRAWPQAAITVLVREAYCELGPLLSPHVAWLGTSIDPFRQGPVAAEKELAQLEAAIRMVAPDLIVACTARRTWLDAAVAAMAPSARTVAYGDNSEDPYFGPQLRSVYPQLPEPLFGQIAPAGAGDQDWRRSSGLTHTLLAARAELSAPAFGTDHWSPEALPLLTSYGLSSNQYVICAAAGFANVPIKTWPADRFIQILQWARSQHELPAVLVGSEAESEYLEKIAAATGARVWTPAVAQWPLLCSLVHHSRVVVGNDTGVLHVAAALRRPLVGIFGGGTWPRFVPAGPGAAVVNPLPCFGCGWDCAFGDAPCVKIVAAADVEQALAHVLTAPAQGECAIVETHHLAPEMTELMGVAAQRYRARGAALDQRERQFQDTVRLAGVKDAEIQALKQETDGKDAEIAALKSETDEKDREIDSLKAATNGMDREIKSLKTATDLKDAEIASLKAEADGKDVEIQSLKRTAEERGQSSVASAAAVREITHEAELRLREIDRLTAACAELQRACDERLVVIEQLDAALKAARAPGSAS